MKIDKFQILNLDRKIRTGFHSEARAQLKGMLQAEIPREFFFQVAALARRLSRSEIGLRLLNPLVRPPERKQIIATVEERAEYAACLIRLGLLKEAHTLLDNVSEKKHPYSLLFRAFAYIAQWDFERSEAYLKNFIRLQPDLPYEILIAKVNLAVGLVFQEKYKEARLLLDELAELTLRDKNMLLYSNTMELMAQIAILTERYDDAQKAIDAGLAALPDSDTVDAFLLKKDAAVLKFFRSGQTFKNYKLIREIKEEALKRSEWEQSRDCDFYLAFAKTSQPEIVRLFFGTPFPGYRQRLLEKAKIQESDLPNEFSWVLGNGPKKIKIQLLNGQTDHSQVYVKTGHIPQRIFEALASDFYRPLRLAEIFAFVFPQEYFSPKSSADKIRQGIKRLRLHFKQSRASLMILEKNGFYQLAAEQNATVEIVCPRRLDPERKTSHRTQVQISKIKVQLTTFGMTQSKQTFTVAAFADFLNASERTAVRTLKKGIEVGFVNRTGTGRFTRYSLKDA